MASFMEQLWESIFTAGTTPTLLVATNASFAALQIVFFIMLLATHSIHFIVLSILCGSLWWSINWFAAEIRAAQVKEEEAKRIREARRGSREKEVSADDGEAMDTGDDTEVDTEVEASYSQAKPKLNVPRARPESQSTVFVQKPTGQQGISQAHVLGNPDGLTSASTTGVSPKLAPLEDDALKKRKGMAESSGDLSTDSEWEKVSQGSEGR